MKKFKLFVGIDISKKTLDVMVGKDEPSSTHHQCSNDAKGIGQLLAIIAHYKLKQNQVLICCEHTGAYLDKLAYALRGTEHLLWVVHPLMLKNYATDLNRFKTDKADAKKIMLYAFYHQDRSRAYQYLDDKTAMLKELFTLRRQLVETRTQYLNRKEAVNQKARVHGLTEVVHQHMQSYLNDIIKHVEQEIKSMIASDEKLNNIYQILQSIPGIGPVIAQHILFITDSFKKINNWRTFACYIGTAPFPHTSGTSVKTRTRVSRKSYKPLKADLNQGIVSIIRPGQLFHSYYKSLIQQNLHHLYILNKLKNIIIKVAFDLVKKNQVFNEELFLANKKSMQINLAMS